MAQAHRLFLFTLPAPIVFKSCYTILQSAISSCFTPIIKCLYSFITVPKSLVGKNQSMMVLRIYLAI